MGIIDTLNLGPEQVAQQNPELHQMRKIAFGEDYLQDIAQGTGTAQYYSGWGNVPSLSPQEAATIPADTAQIPGAVDTLVGGGGGGGQPTGIMATGAVAPTGGAQNPLTQMITTPTGETMSVKEAMTQPGAYDIPGTMPLTPVSGAWGPQEYLQRPTDITQDPMTGDARIAEQIAAQDRASRVTLPSGDVFAAGDYSDVAGTLGDPTEKMDVSPEAQSAWQKVQSGLGSVGDFITKFGPATYQALKGNIGGAALALGNPLAPLALAGQGIMGAIPEWSEADIAAKQYAQPSDQFDPSGSLGKDEFGINTRSDFSGRTYADRIDDRIAELEARDATIGNKAGGYHENELNTLKNRQKEMGTPDYETGEHWDIEPGKPFRDTDEDIITPPKKPEQDLDLYDEWRTIIDAPESVYQEPTVAGPFDYMQPGYQTPLDREALGTDLEGINIDKITSTDPLTTGTALDAFSPINRQQHFDNTEKLKDAVRAGEISPETYNRLSAYDATKTMGLGPITGTAATIGYQGIQTLAGDQGVGDMVGDIRRNVAGVTGNITPFEQQEYDRIIGGIEPVGGMYPGGRQELLDDTTPTPTIEDIAKDSQYGTYMPEQAPTPTVPDFISGGGRDEPPSRPDPTPDFSGYDAGGDDPAPAPAAPAVTGPTYGPHGGGGGGGGGCFLPNTPITMANGSTKPIKDVDIGDEVAKGGKVFATGKFLVDNLHDYKGIKVSGSHMVNEDGNWTRVEDSKHGKPLGDDEHIVYVFGAENRRILINNILFTDYFEVPEQKNLVKYGEEWSHEWREYTQKIEKQNVSILNAS